MCVYQRSIKKYQSNFCHISYIYYELLPTTRHSSCCIFLHGIRLTAKQTFDGIINYLNKETWSDIIAINIPGVDDFDENNKDIQDYSLSDIINGIKSIVDQHGWEQYDIVGYSYGGFLTTVLAKADALRVRRQALIESALLVAPPDKIPIVLNKMYELANLAEKNANAANEDFTQLVTKSKQPFHLAMNRRPLNNPRGFAHLLKLLVEYCRNTDLELTFHSQKNISIMLNMHASKEAMDMAHYCKKNYGWNLFILNDDNHSVIFRKPELIAKTLIQWRNSNDYSRI